VITAISAIAPPGGCTVSVNCIAAMLVDTANAAAVARSKWFIDRRHRHPIRAESKFPPIKFRGCASGELGAA